MGRHARFIVLTLGLAALLLAAVAAFNYRVDPFQHYRLSQEPRFPRALQRYINPGLARHGDYDMVISGSSLMENYSLAAVNAQCGARAINLAYSAMAAYEQRRILEIALAKPKRVKRVVMTLDFNSFAAPIEGSLPDIPEPLPLYLYNDHALDDFRYLLNGSVTAHAFAIARKVPKGNFSTDPDRAWSWVKEVSFSKARALKDIDPADINKRFRQGPRTLAHMQVSFEANYARLIESHPGTEFNLVFPPYSIVVWADFAQRNQVDVSLAFKRHVFERLAKLPNARVFDMQWDASITHDFDRYADIYHFDPAINDLLMAAACGGQSGGESPYRVTVESLPRFESALTAQIAAATVAKWVAEAKATAKQ